MELEKYLEKKLKESRARLSKDLKSRWLYGYCDALQDILDLLRKEKK